MREPKSGMPKFRSIDLFAGIGGIRRGFERAFGERIETVFASEWDEWAVKTYQANYGADMAVAGDITQIDEKDIPSFDICLAGFPCQAFSLAGMRRGFDDDYKGMARGTLFFDVARICSQHKPKVIFCENVKGLTIHDKGRTFDIIKGTLEEIGYTVFEKILNSRDFGVPQNRERIYIVAFRNDIAPKEFNFPEPCDSTKRIRDIMESETVSVKYYLSDRYMNTLVKHRERHEAKGHGFGYEIRSLDDVAGAIVCGGMGHERNLIVDDRLTDFEPVTHIKGTVNRKGIRKMTPREWARLQGFDDDFLLPLADTHSFKQLGNSVTVNVIEAIAKKIKAVLEDERKTMSLSGNKGEWSEVYALLKLLADGKLYAADEDLNKKETFYEIIKIYRKENIGEIVFAYDDTRDNISIFCKENKEITVFLPRTDFDGEAKELLKVIKKGDGAFTVPAIDGFLQKIKCGKLKAPSNDKADIQMKAYDTHTCSQQKFGFSIKSSLGKPPTLLNAGKTTNFTYKIIGGINETAVSEFNSDNGNFNQKFKRLFSEGYKVEFVDMDNVTFKNNLMLIDADLPKITALMLLEHYAYGNTQIKSALEALNNKNPLGYPKNSIQPFYEYKFKKLVTESALGMTPAKIWQGKADANGGYIVVREDGEVVCYHLYNRNEFEDYLIKNTRFETASRERHGFGIIYEENDSYSLKLNLQIRFIK
ncbi:hypothetical protein AGMMS49975_03110 [Clostridia bacterium]|nr:hypothetical protein AGMMS49975_03110 [Clostridia bacterium]